MDFNNFKTYSDSPQNAFETFCTQLFERYLRRKYNSYLIKFRVVNGAGGDGGIEAYGELQNGDLIAVQAKWFLTSMQNSHIKQIEKSVRTAMNHRKNIVEYFICVPRSLASVKTGKGKVAVVNTEENRIDNLNTKIKEDFPNTTFTWWFEQDMQNELLEADNEGMNKFWFERDIITHDQLVQQFEIEKAAWIYKRYIPELHGHGVIQEHIEEVLYSRSYRKNLLNRIEKVTKSLQNTSSLITRFSETLEKSNNMLPESYSIRSIVDDNLAALLPIITAIQEGVNKFPIKNFQAVLVSRDLLIDLENWQPSSLQLGLDRRLRDSLIRIVDLDLQNVIDQINDEMEQSGKLFLGEGGTGKTHAISNTVDVRLNEQELPALIIRAKSAPVGDWTSLLKKPSILIIGTKTKYCLALKH